MAGLQVGRKIYTINEDLLFLRPFSEVEAMINQAFCIRRSLRLLVATKAKEWVPWINQVNVFSRHQAQAVLTRLFSLSRIVKIPDNPESLSFRLSGSEPPHVHAVRKGETSWRRLRETRLTCFWDVVTKCQSDADVGGGNETKCKKIWRTKKTLERPHGIYFESSEGAAFISNKQSSTYSWISRKINRFLCSLAFHPHKYCVLYH